MFAIIYVRHYSVPGFDCALAWRRGRPSEVMPAKPSAAQAFGFQGVNRAYHFTILLLDGEQP
jgi:hypothetical protein